MPHISLAVTDRRTRVEWVKMFYGDIPKGIPVGIIRQSGTGLRVLDHRTPESQWSDLYQSPMGLDVGTLKYLRELTPAVDGVVWGVLNSMEPLLLCPMLEFYQVRPVTAVLSGGAPRTRIFVPVSKWITIPFYPELRPLYWDVTELEETGRVRARHVETDRKGAPERWL